MPIPFAHAGFVTRVWDQLAFVMTSVILERTVGRGRDGVVKSPFRMRGYWQDPEQTAAVLDADGWLVSSDLGFLDGDGNLTLAGRASEVYIRGGYNVYPLEVENVLTAHPSVAAAAVVGLETPVIGEIGVAYVVPAPGQEPDLGTLRTWCTRHIADYKVPDRLEVVPELPLSPALKVDKRALARRAAGQG